MKYIIAVQTPARRLSGVSFAVESAFASHLVALKKEIEGNADRIVLVAPQMSSEDFSRQERHLAVLGDADGIEFLPAYRLPTSASKFWFGELLPMLWKLMPVVRSARVVHSGMSFDIRQPMLAWVNFLAIIYRRPTLFVLDIDFRADAARYLQLNRWSRSKYLANVFFLNPWRVAQVRVASSMCDLVLLKGGKLVDDFGRGKPNVKNFHDTTHSIEQVMSGRELIERLDWLADEQGSLTVCYFGRLVWKKGLDKVLIACSLARQRGCNVKLKIIGDGDCRAALQEQVASLGLNAHVEFHRQVAYGAELFDLLSTAHLCLGTPLIEDTPRAAFDAFARALPVLAFDTAYFSDLARSSGGVELVPWPDPKALADRIVALASNRGRLVQMAKNGVEFAGVNTQEVWVRRRIEWTKNILLAK